MYRVLTFTPKESFGSNTYYVPDGSAAFIVDPSVPVAQVKQELGADFIPPAMILLTHGHFDHVETLPEWYAAFSPAVYIGEADAPMLSDAYLNAYRFFYGADRTYFVPHKTCRDGDEIPFGKARISVLSFPGHTPGGTGYRLSDMAFVGDLIFAGGGYGRFDLPGGDYAALVESLRRAQKRLADIVLYPGHGESFEI